MFESCLQSSSARQTGMLRATPHSSTSVLVHGQHMSRQHSKTKNGANAWTLFLMCLSSKVACFNIQGSKQASFARGRYRSYKPLVVVA